MSDESRPHDDVPGDPAAPPGSAHGDIPAAEGPSRKAAWLGMGAVAVALGLLWMVPNLGDSPTIEELGGAAAGIEFPGEPEDADATGKPARLDFTMKDMSGVNVKLASFKGKIILLNFWATWCGPCKVEIPDLVALQDKYRDDLVILGVLVQDDMNEKIPAFATQYKINYPVLDGNNREDVEIAYGPFYGIPSSVIIGRDGVIAMKHSGIASREQFERELRPLLGGIREADSE